MDDLARWLENLGLGNYAEVFAENEITFEDVSDLGDADLRELGLAMGPRKRFMRAVARLGEGEGEAARSAAPPPAPTSAPSAEAERRQLTVMFVDLVGSTALSERLDPEDLREVLRAYQETCAESVGRFGGHIAKYIGDGLLVYFGYPQAHEDDARRAVNAGLGVVTGIAALNRRLGEDQGVELAVRVGIHTGLVVAGEMGVGESREAGAIVGETPNLAARLERLAAPDTVVISAATRRLVEGLFECDDLGPQRLKGISEAVATFRVRGVSDAPSRFEAATQRGLTELVGRGSEVDLLLDRWAHATEGEAQVVLLSGEAGIGKSRILRAVHERLEGEPHDEVIYHCSPYHQNSALYPAIEQLERALRFATSDRAQHKLDKLEAALSGLSLAVDELAPPLASMLSLPAEGRYPAQAVSPQLLRRRTLEALLSVIEARAARTPVLMVVEDAHWIDPSTLEMLGLLIERLRSARIFLLVNCRPEFEPSWGRHAHLTGLRLNRLSFKESAEVVARVVGGKTFPDEVLEQILSRTDGVPLFVEELTKTVLESGLLSREDGGYVLKGPLPPLAIPASLHDSLMARLDRLAAVKEVAQLASTLGRSFSYELLAAISPLDGPDLEAALSELEIAELVFKRGVAPDLTFEFKHALIQDAAYQSLLKSSRQRHHARIAQVLEEKFPATVEGEPELLAHHYTEAGLGGPAIDHWQRAGQRAMQRSAHVEAEGHLRKGLAVLEGMAETPERRRREIALQNTLGVCLMPTRGFGNPEVAEAFARAASICEVEGESTGLFVALRGKGQYQMISGDLPSAREQAHRILDLAQELDDPGLLIEAHHLGWSALTFTADFEAAQRHAEEGIARYDRERHHDLTYVYSGHDPGVCARSFGSLALWQLGYPDRALALCREGRALALELAHPFSITIAMWALGMMHQLRREPGATRETGDRLIEHCNEKGFPPFLPMGRIFRGSALAEAGELAAGVAEMREGIAGVRATGTEYTLPLFFAVLGELCLNGGRTDEGFSALEEGLAMSEKNQDRFILPEFHRLRGALLLRRPGPDKARAEACFKQAIEIARGQQARLLELRATTSLARLWGEGGKRAQAHDCLAPVYAWFSEGFDSADLVDAKALLEQLS
ncbi:MAG: adenylate/guanylate cyclase domain-containing protein [Alphaproteobacteria bacterium]